MARNDPRVMKLVGSIFTLVGSAMLGGSGWSGNRQYTILKTWPSVEVDVLQSEVTSGRDSEGTTMYGTEITFRYTIDGKEYTTPTTSSYRSSSYTEMKEKAEKYSPGTRHAIRYNPSNPSDVRFDVGYNLGFFLLPFIMGIMGLVFSGLGVGLLFASRGARARRCPSCHQPVAQGQNFCPHCAAALPVD